MERAIAALRRFATNSPWMRFCRSNCRRSVQRMVEFTVGMHWTPCARRDPVVSSRAWKVRSTKSRNSVAHRRSTIDHGCSKGSLARNFWVNEAMSSQSHGNRVIRGELTEYYHNYVRTAYRMLTQSFQKFVTDEMSNENLMFLENRSLDWAM